MHRYNYHPTCVTAAMFGLLLSGCEGTSKSPPNSVGGHTDHAHPPEMTDRVSATLVLKTTPDRPRAEQSVGLQLMLHDDTGRMLKEFEPTHEKLAHLILVREGLDEFAHVHPSVDSSGIMTATHTFLLGGRYFVFLDFKPSGRPAATAQGNLIIEGDAPSPPALMPDVPGMLKGDGLQANVSMRTSPDLAQIVSFQVKDMSGTPVNDLQPYLGAMGHFVVLSVDGARYVHAHPLTERATDGIVEFQVHFPGEGTYKGWGQFQRGGEVFTIPAVMQVGSRPPLR